MAQRKDTPKERYTEIMEGRKGGGFGGGGKGSGGKSEGMQKYKERIRSQCEEEERKTEGERIET